MQGTVELIYHFENYSFDVDRQELRREAELVSIEPQVLDLLHYFIRNRERVVSKDDLIANVWNGRIVSESTLTSRITSARQAIGDSGEQQRLIRTIPRKGLRFIGEINTALPSENGQAAALEVSSPVPPQPEGHGQAAKATALPLPDKPSIAVLPFTNMSGDSQQEFFADGITEDITTALSRLRWLFVIARNSSFAYKGKSVDVRQIARELGVRYILEGSVRESGDRLRISAQLIDAVTGTHIWAQRYDRDVAGVFAVQDDITSQVVASIEPQLYAAEDIRAKHKPPESLDAWGCVARALSLMNKPTKNDNAAAQKLLKNAIAIDPSYAQAYSLLAYSMSIGVILGWQPAEGVLEPAWEIAQKAVHLDVDDPWAHLALGHLNRQHRNFEDAIAEFHNALALNPNFAFARTQLGYALSYPGRTDEALAEFDTAERLSPRDIQAGTNNVGRAIACFIGGRYREGMAFARTAIRQNPEYLAAHRQLVANGALAGEVEEAKAALHVLKRLVPDLSLKSLQSVVFVREEDRRRYFEAFRLVGLE